MHSTHLKTLGHVNESKMAKGGRIVAMHLVVDESGERVERFGNLDRNNKLRSDVLIWRYFVDKWVVSYLHDTFPWYVR